MKKHIISLVSIIIFIPTVILLFRFHSYEARIEVERLKSTYPMIHLEENIDSKVVSIEYGNPKKVRLNSDIAFITLDNKNKRAVYTVYQPNEVSLNEVLKTNSFLEKKAHDKYLLISNTNGSDTIKYRFKLIFPSK